MDVFENWLYRYTAIPIIWPFKREKNGILSDQLNGLLGDPIFRQSHN